MTTPGPSHDKPSVVEVIRDDLREITAIQRRNHRENELNKQRVALGDVSIDEESWDREKVIAKANELKRKPLPKPEYLKLQTALIQNEDNINGFFTVNNIMPAIIRDLTSANPDIQLIAAHCCCNISLGNQKACRTLCKYIGPYLVEQLSTLSNHLVEASLWTIGNLCTGSEDAFKILHAQGCLNRLLSLLRDCDIIILPSVMYAVTHYLNVGSELIPNSEAVEMAKILINHAHLDSPTALWIIALLSSKPACTETLIAILPSVVDALHAKLNDTVPDTKYITAAVRLLANTSAESTGYAGSIIFHNQKYTMEEIQLLFDKLLLYSHLHVRKETLWLIGNLYNHPQPEINQGMKNILSHLSNLSHAIQSVR